MDFEEIRNTIGMSVKRTVEKILRKNGLIWMDAEPLSKLNGETDDQDAIDLIMREVMHRDLYACFRHYVRDKEFCNLEKFYEFVWDNVQYIKASLLIKGNPVYYLEIKDANEFEYFGTCILAVNENGCLWGLRFALSMLRDSLGCDNIFDLYPRYSSVMRSGLIKLFADHREDNSSLKDKELGLLWSAILEYGRVYSSADGVVRNITVNHQLYDYLANLWRTEQKIYDKDLYRLDMEAIRELCEDTLFADQNIKGLDGYLYPDKYIATIIYKLLYLKTPKVLVANDEETAALLVMLDRLLQEGVECDCSYDTFKLGETGIQVEFSKWHHADDQATIHSFEDE